MKRYRNQEIYADPQFIESNGFRGTSFCNYKKFCEELYLTLYSSKEGYEDTAMILLDL